MKKTLDKRILSVLSYTLCGLAAIICVMPFWLILSGSFSAEKDILWHGYSFWPRNISLEAYRMVFKIPERIVRAYGVSTLVTFGGGSFSLFLTTMTAYVLLRKDFKYRNTFSKFFYFPTLFNGGMIASYILITQYLRLKDSLLVLIVPALLTTWNILMMRNFMNSIPDSIMESAKLDGAGDFRIFISFYLPLSAAGLATIGLFIGLNYWNDWYRAMLYLNKPDLFPLQYLLYSMLASISAMREIAEQMSFPLSTMPSETFKMAMTIVVTGPILLLYPFVQRYFVKGITIGAVKG